MDWIKEILDKYVDDEGKIDLTKAMDEVKTEFPKQAVPKATFNDKLEDLKVANKLVEDLKKDNKDVEELQTKITQYEEDIENINSERLQERKTYTLKEKLKEAGAKDVDYMIYKLGDVEVDGDGNIKDLDNKLKELKETNSTMFEAAKEPEQIVDDKGFKVLDNKLDDGKTSKTYSISEIGKMTTEDINKNWDAVSASLEKGED